MLQNDDRAALPRRSKEATLSAPPPRGRRRGATSECCGPPALIMEGFRDLVLRPQPVYVLGCTLRRVRTGGTSVVRQRPSPTERKVTPPWSLVDSELSTLRETAPPLKDSHNAHDNYIQGPRVPRDPVE